MKTLLQSVSLSALALFVAGCTTPNPTPLNKPDDVPPAFTAPIAPDAPMYPTVDWWTGFQSPELPALEAKAQAENLDLAAAAARVLQAEANRGIAFAPLLPTVNGNFSGQRSGRGGTSIDPSTGLLISRGSTNNAFQLGGSASYELDFWGLNQDRLRQARESLRAARYAQTVINLTTTADVANEYFTVLALRERIKIARDNVDAAKRILAITQAKVTNGVSSNLDLAQQQATLYGQEARIPALVEQEREARYALAILLGRAPEGFDVAAQNLNGLVSPTVAPGIPSAILERRPDVTEAEAQLFAAHANVDAARANFFPAFNLTGSGGWQSSMINSLVNPSSVFFSIGLSVVQTIFDGGLKHAQSDLARAQETELLADYRKTVFTAFQDVETSLGSVSSNNDQLALTESETKAAAEAFRISELQYREGVTDLLSVLQAQQTLFTAEDTLVQIKQARLEADVSLYRSLGGGWTMASADKAYQSQLDWWPL